MRPKFSTARCNLLRYCQKRRVAFITTIRFTGRDKGEKGPVSLAGQLNDTELLQKSKRIEETPRFDDLSVHDMDKFEEDDFYLVAVGSIPMNSPSWMPVAVQRTATVSPSTTISSIPSVASGNAE